MAKQVFLERTSYRMRRLMDAVRLLPLLGLVLWMVPLLWSVPSELNDATPMPMSRALQYVFGIWILLVACCWGLWRRTHQEVEGPRSMSETDAP